jgi:hypothetical protein
VIPATNQAAHAGPCSVAVADVVNRPVMVDAGQQWRAEFNYSVLARCFPQHPRVKQGIDAAFAAYAAGDRRGEPGRFTVRPDGTATFEQRWFANGQAVLEMRGTRVSGETITYR